MLVITMNNIKRSSMIARMRLVLSIGVIPLKNKTYRIFFKSLNFTFFFTSFPYFKFLPFFSFHFDDEISMTPFFRLSPKSVLQIVNNNKNNALNSSTSREQRFNCLRTCMLLLLQTCMRIRIHTHARTYTHTHRETNCIRLFVCVSCCVLYVCTWVSEI